MYSQLGSKSRPLLVVQRITCTSFDTIFQYNDICTYMYQFWYCFQYKYMVQNIIFWPVYSQLGSKSRPLLVRNFGLCTSQIVVYEPKLRYSVVLQLELQPRFYRSMQELRARPAQLSRYDTKLVYYFNFEIIISSTDPCGGYNYKN